MDLDQSVVQGLRLPPEALVQPNGGEGLETLQRVVVLLPDLRPADLVGGAELLLGRGIEAQALVRAAKGLPDRCLLVGVIREPLRDLARGPVEGVDDES